MSTPPGGFAIGPGFDIPLGHLPGTPINRVFSSDSKTFVFVEMILDFIQDLFER